MIPEFLETNSTTEQKIINISQREPNDNEIKLLEFGLKFTPTPEVDQVDLSKDTEELCRRLRLREFFENENFDDGSLVKTKKGFKPPFNRDKKSENYIACLKKVSKFE